MHPTNPNKFIGCQNRSSADEIDGDIHRRRLHRVQGVLQHTFDCLLCTIDDGLFKGCYTGNVPNGHLPSSDGDVCSSKGCTIEDTGFGCDSMSDRVGTNSYPFRMRILADERATSETDTRTEMCDEQGFFRAKRWGYLVT